MRELKLSRQALNICRRFSARSLNKSPYFTGLEAAPQVNRATGLAAEGALNHAHLGQSSTPSFEAKPSSDNNRWLDLDFLLKTTDKVEVPHWVNSPIDLAMYKSTNLDELLKVAEKFRLSGLQTATFFVQMARFAPLDVEKLENDARFLACHQSLMRETEFLPFNYLLIAFRSLLYVGFPRQTGLCAQLQSEIEKRIKDNKISLLALTSFACFHVDHVESDQSELQKMMETCIFDQLNQISDPQHVLLVLNKLCRDRKENCEKMAAAEERALELMDFMSPEDLVNLLTYVSTARSRNVRLLKAVAGKIVASSGCFSPKRIVSILVSLNKLSYFTPALLQRIFMDLKPQVEKMKPMDFHQICNQLGLCRLRHTGTIDNLVNWLSSNYTSCKPPELVGFILMLARCNYTSNIAIDLCERIKTDLTLGAVKNDKLLWLDYIWALAVLNLLNSSLAKSVLNDSFYKSLIDDSDKYRATVNKLKLLNINAAVEVDLKEASPLPLSPLSQHFVLVKNLQMIRRKQKAKLVDQLLESLNVLAPKDTYMKFAQITPEGYAIDAEIMVDENSKPIPVKDWSLSSNAGRKNIAFIFSDYTDRTLLSNSLTGLNAMAERHLQGKGRLVAEVPAYEFKKRQNILERATYLKSLIDRINSAKDS